MLQQFHNIPKLTCQLTHGLTKNSNLLLLLLFCYANIGIVGVRAQIGILGLGPYSRTWIRPRRNR